MLSRLIFDVVDNIRKRKRKRMTVRTAKYGINVVKLILGIFYSKILTDNHFDNYVQINQ